MPQFLPAPDRELIQDAAASPGPDVLGLPEVVTAGTAAGTGSLGGDEKGPGGWLTRIASLLGVDRAIAFTVLARGWSSLAGVMTLALIARFLSPAEQGFYYTFYALVNLQIIFELGFSVVVLQTASHEAAHLTLHPDGSVTGPAAMHSRLASVLQRAVRWYAVAAVLMAAVLLPLGALFFSRGAHAGAAGGVAWFAPWVLVVLATTCTFQVDPLFSFLEGCGYVPQVARTRLLQAVLASSLGWLALLLHHGLFAPGLMILGQALVGGGFVLSRRRLLRPLLRYPARGAVVDWRTEIWPFQWRLAVSWLCGYFTFQLFNPILFAMRGPVEAGQMGMSLNICNTLSSMAVAWINTKAAPFGRLIALKDYGGLDRSFFRALWQSTAAAVLAAALVAAVTAELRAHRVAFALRLLPPGAFALLLAGTVMNIVVFGYALYLRAHKQEKFMSNSIVGALWMAPAALLLGRAYGAMGIAAAYAGGSVVIGLGYGTYTFQKWRALWHG